MSKYTLEAPRSDIYNIRYDNASISIRMNEEPEHPDYDARVELPIDEELKESIRMVGMLEPAIGYKGAIADGAQIIWLVVGRQRWKAIRSIWSDMESEGQDMSLAPAFKLILQKTEDAGKRRQKRIIENRHRQELGGIALAKELAAHFSIVGEDDEAREQARITFNFKSLAAMDNCLALLETTPKVQEQLSKGVLSPTAGLQIAHQPEEIQDEIAERAESVYQETGRSVPVSQTREIIREVTGQQQFQVSTLFEIDSQLKKWEKQYEAATDNLARINGIPEYADQKDGAISEVSIALGWITALKWVRGEGRKSRLEEKQEKIDKKRGVKTPTVTETASDSGDDLLPDPSQIPMFDEREPSSEPEHEEYSETEGTVA